MTSPIAYGIDFGTTNSSISVAYPDRIEVIRLADEGPMPQMMPSMAYLHRSGNRSAGTDAVQFYLITGSAQTVCRRCELVAHDTDGAYTECRQYRPGGSCMDARLMAGLKSELASPLFLSTHSWARDFDLSDLVAIVLEHMKRRVDERVGESVDRLVLGHPVAFFGTGGDQFEDLQELAEQRLVDAARRAGFTDVQPYPEPAAAVLDEELDDGFMVSVDFGGGTFDVAVIEVGGGEGEIVGLQGAPVGGTLIDGDLFDVKIADQLGLNGSYGSPRLPIPGWFRTGLRTLGGVKHLLANPMTPIVLGDLRRGHTYGGAVVDGILFGGYAYDFFQAVEGAKIRLSEQGDTTIEFHRPGIDLSIPLGRSELERIARPYLDTAEAQIDRALDQAGIGAGDVTTVLRTGGSSLLASFVDRLDAKFGADKVHAREAFTSVAYGLGVVAQEEWS